MKPGKYKNRLGMVLHVMGPFYGNRRTSTLGGIYEAEARDPLFGVTTYLVTQASMAGAGYEPISDDATVDHA